MNVNMQGDTIVFYPKYTTLLGHASAGGIFYSDPYDVTGFNQIDIEVFLDSETGAGGAFDAIIEESSDLETWNPVGTNANPIALGSQKISATNTLRYVRVIIETNAAGTGETATLWIKGVARNT